MDTKERVQKTFDLNTPNPPRKRTPGKRVRVYNKYGARIHTSDGILEPHEEGEIAESDLKHPFIKEKVVQVR